MLAPEQYAILPCDQCHSEPRQHYPAPHPAPHRTLADRPAPHRATPPGYAHSGSDFNAVPDFARVLPRSRRLRALPGHRLEAPRLFHDLDLTGCAGHRDRFDGDRHPDPRAARAFRPPPDHRPLDISALAVRFHDRSPRLLHVVPVVRATLDPSVFDGAPGTGSVSVRVRMLTDVYRSTQEDRKSTRLNSSH